MTVRYNPNHKGIGEMLRSDFILRHLLERGDAIRAYGEMIAPVGDDEDPHAGRYKASFNMRYSRHGGATRDRAEVVVYNEAPEAVFVEWGLTSGQRPYHTVLRAGAEGGRLV